MKTNIKVTKDGLTFNQQWADIPEGVSFVRISQGRGTDCLVAKYMGKYHLIGVEGEMRLWDNRDERGLPPLLHVYQSAHIQLK